MLNPSNADARQNDPTVRRCMSFARREGFGRLEVVNLYAYRSATPRDLGQVDNPVGYGNDREIRSAVQRASLIVAAWGNAADPFRSSDVISIIELSGKPVKCFGLTKNGHPKHPLYVGSDTALQIFADAFLNSHKKRTTSLLGGKISEILPS